MLPWVSWAVGAGREGHPSFEAPELTQSPRGTPASRRGAAPRAGCVDIASKEEAGCLLVRGVLVLSSFVISTAASHVGFKEETLSREENHEDAYK